MLVTFKKFLQIYFGNKLEIYHYSHRKILLPNTLHFFQVIISVSKLEEKKYVFLCLLRTLRQKECSISRRPKTVEDKVFTTDH